jgi:hypothetical protein
VPIGLAWAGLWAVSNRNEESCLWTWVPSVSLLFSGSILSRLKGASNRQHALEIVLGSVLKADLGIFSTFYKVIYSPTCKEVEAYLIIYRKISDIHSLP